MSQDSSYPNTDSEIIGEILQGRKQFFQKLVTRYQIPIKKFVWNFFRKNNIVDDLTQEIFLKAFSNLNSIKKPEKFKNWLIRISHNVCIDFGWKENLLPEIPIEALYGQEPSQTSVEFEGNTLLDETAVKTLLEKLPPRDCLIVWLAYVEDLSYNEIAQIVEQNEGAVRQRASRAIRFLRRHIK